MLNIFVPLNHSKLPKILTLVGLLVLVAIAFLTFWSARDFVSAARWRRHSYSVRYEARAFTASLESLKSSLFSMAIQPRIVTIEQFNSSKQDLQRNLSSLRDLVADNATQAEKVQKISQLISEKTPIWEKLSHELIRGKSLKNRADFHYLLNQTTTVNVDAQIAALEAEEDLLLMQRGTKAERLFELTSAVVISGIIVAFLLFFFSNNLLQKEILRREETEKELQRAKQKSIEASELKSSFLANMSHEIRTPLNGIIGMSKLLEHTPLNARQVDYVETIKTSSNSLLALINDILDFSKIESGKFQLEETNFELKSLLKSAVSIVDYSAKSKGLEIITDIENTVPEFLVGDPLRLRQVLLNLLNNAIKFSDTGTIKLLVQKLATTDDSQAKLLFEVIDQGVGFDAETRQKLFQSFSQGDNSMSRRYGGTGLGLAISKQIVELMSGGIDVESTKGVGSKFFFNVLLKVPKKDSTIQSISKMHTI
ncbi:MAG: CHASE3 domain-containing protein, partial [Bdellovibrio sp.]|nr:CHASE3 domain-containing protein [Bdellovibrio sp.]